MSTKDPTPKYCPFCGGKPIRSPSLGLLRCDAYRIVFIISYARRLKRLKSIKHKERSRGPEPELDHVTFSKEVIAIRAQASKV